MLRCQQLEAVLVCFGEIFVDYRPNERISRHAAAHNAALNNHQT